MEKTHQLIDNIYNAALMPSEWPSVLQSLQAMFNANAAGIYILDTVNARLTQFELQGIDNYHIDSYINHYMLNNPWIGVPELQQPGKIRTDQSLDEHYSTPRFYRKTAYFNEWLEPQDFYYSLGTNLLSHDNINTKFYMYRPKLGRSFSKQEIKKFSHLSRHMTRSMEISRRLALKDSQINDALHFIDQLKFGVIFLDDHANIIHTNQFAEKLIHANDGLLSNNGILATRHKADEKKLFTIIQSAINVYQGQSDIPPGTISLHRPSTKRSLYVTAIPLPQQSSPFPASATVVLFICDPEQDTATPVHYLQQRYGFTPSEAKLAQYLCRGDTLREAAKHAGLTYETARGYLKIIFQKTGARRQVELLRLLLSDQLFVTQ